MVTKQKHALNSGNRESISKKLILSRPNTLVYKREGKEDTAKLSKLCSNLIILIILYNLFPNKSYIEGLILSLAHVDESC